MSRRLFYALLKLGKGSTTKLMPGGALSQVLPLASVDNGLIITPRLGSEYRFFTRSSLLPPWLFESGVVFTASHMVSTDTPEEKGDLTAANLDSPLDLL